MRGIQFPDKRFHLGLLFFTELLTNGKWRYIKLSTKYYCNMKWWVGRLALRMRVATWSGQIRSWHCCRLLPSDWRNFRKTYDGRCLPSLYHTAQTTQDSKSQEYLMSKYYNRKNAQPKVNN